MRVSRLPDTDAETVIDLSQARSEIAHLKPEIERAVRQVRIIKPRVEEAARELRNHEEELKQEMRELERELKNQEHEIQENQKHWQPEARHLNTINAGPGSLLVRSGLSRTTVKSDGRKSSSQAGPGQLRVRNSCRPAWRHTVRRPLPSPTAHVLFRDPDT